ncbi:MAG TPA: LuxR C-terminal-related transcriptional regulator [Solirubrobacteraceae bacterium]|jgi:DNA-binding CsgD family transcriptional regulator|nr:LuxR C-terminal-related transcriptional regulator [Solirubrobacteraceae bacterium]
MARQMHSERGRARQFRRALHNGRLPMVTVATDRRVLDANLASRLLLHQSLDELRHRSADDLIAPREAIQLPGFWSLLLERGHLVGVHELSVGDRAGMRVVVVALANVLPGEHLVLLAPADWSSQDLHGAELPVPRRVAAVLSVREQEVLRLVADGSSLREIGEQLTIAETTVRTHLANANRKLGARNRAHAVALALGLGLIEPGAGSA